MTIIDKDAPRKKDAPGKTAALSPGWPATGRGTAAPTDSALLVTLSSRIHCRTPMKRMDRTESALRGSVRFDAPYGSGRLEKNPAPDGVATYRCMCGFTMDAPAVSLDYAAAC